MGRILDEVVVLVDSEVLSPPAYVVREICRLATGWSRVNRRAVAPAVPSAWLPPRCGAHVRKDSGCTHYLSFTIEMSDYAWKSRMKKWCQ